MNFFTPGGDGFWAVPVLFISSLCLDLWDIFL